MHALVSRTKLPDVTSFLERVTRVLPSATNPLDLQLTAGRRAGELLCDETALK